MRHKLFYSKLQRTSSHRMALLRNLSKSLFEHKSILTTKPKADSLISFVSRFITRLLKKEDAREAYRYINSCISGKEKRSVKSIMDFYNSQKVAPTRSHYLKKQRHSIRSDNAIMMKISLNLSSTSEKPVEKE